MRLFLDANVLFSAAWRDEASALILFELSAAAGAMLQTSGFAAEEARRNLRAKRAERAERVTVLEGLLAQLEIVRAPAAKALQASAAAGLPEKDQPILAAAIQARCDLLVTGDRTHFGHLYGKSIAGVRVVTVAECVEHLLR